MDFCLFSFFSFTFDLNDLPKRRDTSADCRLPTSFLSRMPSRFLNNQWRFCHVRTEQPREPVWILKQILKQIFRSSPVFRFIAIRDFSFWGMTSGQMDQEWFPCQQRSLTTRQKIKICCSPLGDVSRPLRKPSMAFLYRDVISFTRLSPSVETDDFIARSKWEISKLADLVEVIIYRGLHNCQRTV